MSTRPLALLARALFALAFSVTVSAAAQAQGHGHHGPPGGMPPGQAKKMVTMDHATAVTRDVLVRHGYSVVRVDIVHDTRIVYYRSRDHHGRPHGPVERIVIRPSHERYEFQAAPQPVVAEINIKLGF